MIKPMYKYAIRKLIRKYMKQPKKYRFLLLELRMALSDLTVS